MRLYLVLALLCVQTAAGQYVSRRAAAGGGGTTYDTLSMQIANTYADQQMYAAGSVVLNGESSTGDSYVGEYGANADYMGAFQFTFPSAIAAGKTIQSAVLSLYGWDTYNLGSGLVCAVWISDSATVADWTSNNHVMTKPDLPSWCTQTTVACVTYPATRAAGVLWPSSGTMNGVWSTTGWNASPDIKTLIQHLVDTYGGIASGAKIRVWFGSHAILNAGTEVGFRDYAYTTKADAPKLTIIAQH